MGELNSGMIPKIIHYCWFGGNPLPDEAQRCIASWKKHFPDYEIKEWNETNYEVNQIPYIQEAYEKKKYAFVSDYARFDILYKYGGIYFDTDVEVIRPFDDILAKGGFMGQEAGVTKIGLLYTPKDTYTTNEKKRVASLGLVANPGLGLAVAPGLGLAVAPGLGLYKEILDFYSTRHFIKENGSLDTTTICITTTNFLIQHGYDVTKEEIQEVAGITIYPSDYFCPLSYYTGHLTKTKNTHSIHWYSASWLTGLEKFIARIEKCAKGRSSLEWKIRRVIAFPFRVVNKLNKDGIDGVIKTFSSRIKSHTKG